jgi:hypothetical protein
MLNLFSVFIEWALQKAVFEKIKNADFKNGKK